MSRQKQGQDAGEATPDGAPGGVAPVDFEETARRELDKTAGAAEAREGVDEFDDEDEPAHDEREDESTGDEDEEELTDDERRRGRSALSSSLIDALPSSPLLWNAIAVAGVVVSALSLLGGHTDAAFVAAVLGVVAWFVNVRNGLRRGDIEAVQDKERWGKRDEKNRVENE